MLIVTYESKLWRDLRKVSLPHILARNKLNVFRDLTPCQKSKTCLMKMLGGLSYENIQRYCTITHLHDR